VRDYDFLFSDVLKEVIYQTSVNVLLSKGHRYDKTPGLAYQLYPKNYKIKVNCPNDHLMILYIGFEKGKWRMGIGGL
jgi:hypothetical protein